MLAGDRMGTSKSLLNVIYLACASPAFEIVEIFSRLISFRQSNMITFIQYTASSCISLAISPLAGS
jgi:hypothetical protein